jgi:hypothetical protein
MLVHLKKHWRSWAIASSAAIIFIWVAIESDAFQNCMNMNKSYFESSDYGPPKGVAKIIATLRWDKVCTGEFLKEDGEAITAFFTLVLGLSTVGLWISTWNLWEVTNATLTHSEKTAERQLRAYVYLEVIGRGYPPPPKIPDRCSISLIIKNSGSTWARNVRVKHGMIVDPKDADPFAAVKWEDIKPSPIVIGPGQEIGMQFGDLSGEDPREIIGNKRKVFHVAWVTYEDVLSDPPVTRQTQLFRRFNADEEGGISFAWMPTHNCADDNCPK